MRNSLERDQKTKGKKNLEAIHKYQNKRVNNVSSKLNKFTINLPSNTPSKHRKSGIFIAII